MNFSMNDTSNLTSWYNITFPGGFNAAGAVVNITINGSVDPANWTKNKSALFVNVSSSTVSANSSAAQYINISNITLPQTTGNKIINVTTSNGTVSLDFNVVNYSSYGVSLTNITALAQTITTETNATYSLILTNNGNVADSYNLTWDNPNNAVVGANISTTYYSLAAGQTKIFTLNVTNTSSGTVKVNITAKSTNDTSKRAYINTTTTIVTFDVPDAPTSYWGNVTINGVLGSANISVHGPNGAEVANTTSFSNGSYRISVPWISGQEITFKVNGIISGLPRTVDDSGTNNPLNLSVYIYGTLGGSVVKAGTVIGIGGATVTFTNATLGYSVNATTNSLGLYSASVYPATYTINVSKTGYLNNSTTGQIVTANTSTTAPTIGLYPNTVTVTANRTVGSAEAGQDVSFNLTVVNTGENATFTITNASRSGTNVTTTPIFAAA